MTASSTTELLADLVEYLHGDRQAAFDLLEPFEGETEVRR